MSQLAYKIRLWDTHAREPLVLPGTERGLGTARLVASGELKARPWCHMADIVPVAGGAPVLSIWRETAATTATPGYGPVRTAGTPRRDEMTPYRQSILLPDGRRMEGAQCREDGGFVVGCSDHDGVANRDRDGRAYWMVFRDGHGWFFLRWLTPEEEAAWTTLSEAYFTSPACPWRQETNE